LARLRQFYGTPARCLEFCILTATRSDKNPWKENTGGYPCYALILAKRPGTIGAALDLAAAAGWRRKQAYDHLRWLYTWGDYIAVHGKRWGATRSL
jgi:hypothetical protein